MLFINKIYVITINCYKKHSYNNNYNYKETIMIKVYKIKSLSISYNIIYSHHLLYLLIFYNK